MVSLQYIISAIFHTASRISAAQQQKRTREWGGGTELEGRAINQTCTYITISNTDANEERNRKHKVSTVTMNKSM
jgi:hypothetical protein